jgi:enoyl-CoA hydratase
MTYELILTEKRNRVGLITLHRPQALNALNNQLMREVMDALDDFDHDDSIGAMVITGSEKAFAAADARSLYPVT